VCVVHFFQQGQGQTNERLNAQLALQETPEKICCREIKNTFPEMASAAALAQQIRAVNARARPDLFSSLSSSVDEYMGQFHSLCSPSQVAVVIAVISVLLRAYQLYQDNEDDKPIPYERVAVEVAAVAALVLGAYYFCSNDQEDLAWVVVIAFVIAAAYGVISNPAVKSVKKVWRSMSPKRSPPKKSAPAPSPKPAAPVVVQSAPAPSVSSGLII